MLLWQFACCWCACIEVSWCSCCCACTEVSWCSCWCACTEVRWCSCCCACTEMSWCSCCCACTEVSWCSCWCACTEVRWCSCWCACTEAAPPHLSARTTAAAPPHLTSLHWLPIKQRIVYKLCLLMHLVHIGRAPVYLSQSLTTTASLHSRSHLRSASSCRYEQPHKKEVWRTRFHLCRTNALEHPTPTSTNSDKHFNF